MAVYTKQLMAVHGRRTVCFNSPRDVPHKNFSRPILSQKFLTSIFFYGPYSVISQEHNDIICTHCHLQTQHIFHSDRVSPFLGTLIDATKLGLLDKEEYVVSAVLQHRGNLNRLKTVEVLVSWLGYGAE